MFYQIIRDLLKVIFNLVFHIEVRGKENLPTNRGYIVCSNHRTNIDPILLGIPIKPQFNFMAKEELFKNGLVSVVLKGLGAFPVSRGKGDTTALDHATELLGQGKVLAMFPEGTRSKDGVPLRPKSGAAVIAARTGADVVPASICYEGKLHFRSKIIVSYGTFIPNTDLGITGSSPREIKTASNMIMDRIIALLNLAKETQK